MTSGSFGIDGRESEAKEGGRERGRRALRSLPEGGKGKRKRRSRWIQCAHTKAWHCMPCLSRRLPLFSFPERVYLRRYKKKMGEGKRGKKVLKGALRLEEKEKPPPFCFTFE